MLAVDKSSVQVAAVGLKAGWFERVSASSSARFFWGFFARK